MEYSKTIVPTPLGNMVALATTQGLYSLLFEDNFDGFEKKIIQHDSNYRIGSQFSTTLDNTKRWLNDYFSSKFKALQYPTLHLQGSPFFMKAWKALQQIPVSTVLSYGQLAKKLGYANAARAIGRAMNQNAICIVIPCHRVIGANGSLTGYGGGLKRKEWLLQHEGFLIP